MPSRSRHATLSLTQPPTPPPPRQSSQGAAAAPQSPPAAAACSAPPAPPRPPAARCRLPWLRDHHPPRLPQPPQPPPRVIACRQEYRSGRGKTITPRTHDKQDATPTSSLWKKDVARNRLCPLAAHRVYSPLRLFGRFGSSCAFGGRYHKASSPTACRSVKRGKGHNPEAAEMRDTPRASGALHPGIT